MIRHFGDKSQRHGFGPFFLRHAVFGGGPNGLAILDASDSWIDATDSTVTTVDVSGELDVRGTINFSSNVTSSDVTGPDGELGVTLTEGAATAASQFRWDNPANLNSGYVDIRWRYRTTEYVDDLGADTDRWRSYIQHGSDPNYLIFPPPSKYSDDDYAHRDVATNVGFAYGCEIVRVTGDWRETRLKTQIYGGSGTNFWPGVRSAGTITGNSQAFMDIAAIEYTQSRVSQVTDVRDATVRYTEASNVARQCLAPDLWVDGSACFVESRNDGTNDLTPFGGTDTPATLSATLKVYRDSLPSSGKVLRIGDIELHAGTDRDWHIIQGATDIDTGAKVPSVPGCVTLRVSGGTASVFVDGRSVGSTSMTQGGTGWAIGGGTAEVIWKSESHTASELSDAQIAAVSSELRSRAGLPARWPLVLWDGQSNAVDSGPGWSLQGSMVEGIESKPGWSFRLHTEGTTSGEWINGAPNGRTSDGSNFFGGNSGWFAAAQNGSYPCAVLNCGKGGTSITSWSDPGGTMRLHIESSVASAEAEFGTHLFEWAYVGWVQGEADAGSEALADAYEANFETVRTWLRGLLGEQVQIVISRLSENVTTLGFESTVRAAQDSLASTYSDVHIYEPTDDAGDFSDAVHFEKFRGGDPQLGRGIFGAARVPQPFLRMSTDRYTGTVIASGTPDLWTSIPNTGSLGGTAFSFISQPPEVSTAAYTKRTALVTNTATRIRTGLTKAQLTNKLHNSEDVHLMWRFKFSSLSALAWLFGSTTGGTTSYGAYMTVSTAGTLRAVVCNGSGTLAMDVSSASGVVSATGDHIFEYRKSGADVTVWADGVQVSSGTITTPGANDASFDLEMNYPNAAAPQGHHSEWMAFDAPLSVADAAHYRAVMARFRE